MTVKQVINKPWKNKSFHETLEESLTLPQLFEKYPHLARLQYEELKDEETKLEEGKKQLKLLLD